MIKIGVLLVAVYSIISVICLAEEILIRIDRKDYSRLYKVLAVFGWPITNLVWLVTLFRGRPTGKEGEISEVEISIKEGETST